MSVKKDAPGRRLCTSFRVMGAASPPESEAWAELIGPLGRVGVAAGFCLDGDRAAAIAARDEPAGQTRINQRLDSSPPHFGCLA